MTLIQLIWPTFTDGDGGRGWEQSRFMKCAPRSLEEDEAWLKEAFLVMGLSHSSNLPVIAMLPFEWHNGGVWREGMVFLSEWFSFIIHGGAHDRNLKALLRQNETKPF